MLAISGLRPRLKLAAPASGLVPTPSTVTPMYSTMPSIVGKAENAPILPVKVVGSAQISSASAAIQ